MPACSSCRRRAAVEQPQHRFLAVDGRIRRASQIEALVPDGGAEAAILWQPVLGDVHARQHLHTRDDSGCERRRQHRDLAERAVHAEPDVEVVLPPLEVDVAGAVSRRAAR